jgi:transcriptional regulator with XRE-family HTH domain
MTSKAPQPVDLILGRNIRLRRVMKGISQTALASKIGVTFQQVQKYEGGTNRVSASRLSRIAQVLDAPVGVFFDGGPNERKEARKDHSPLALLSERQALRVARALLKIADPNIRKSCMKLVEKLAEDRKTHRRQT